MDQRLPLIAGIAVAAAIMIGGLVLIFTRGADRAPESSVPATAPQTRASVGGAFTLVNAKGETVTEQSFAGKYLMVFFGFTHCPDICPTALDDMGRALQVLGPEAARITPIFISVDPERDTPQVVGDYVAFYDTRIVGLTGSPEQIAAVAKTYKVYFAKTELEGGGYTVDHSSLIIVMGPDGTFRGVIQHNDAPEAMAATLTRFMKEDQG